MKIIGEVLLALDGRDWTIVVEAWRDFGVMPTRDEWIVHNAASNDRSQRLTDGKLWKAWLKFDKIDNPFRGYPGQHLAFANDLFLLLNQG